MRGLPAVALVLAAAPARAEHDHGPTEAGLDASTVTASIALVAASYETLYYAGDYEGAIASLRWSHGRFGAAASVPAYRLVGNGRASWGLGDVAVHAQAVLAGDAALAFGVAFGVGLPTGNDRPGLGMGHTMLMPAAFVVAARGAVRVHGSAGYGRALGTEGHAHGAWPIVDPMNQAEVTLAAGAELALAEVWRVGARLAAALATTDEEGSASRAIAGVRGGVVHGRFDTGLELQLGVVGDPFTLRGLVQTSIRF